MRKHSENQGIFTITDEVNQFDPLERNDYFLIRISDELELTQYVTKLKVSLTDSQMQKQSNSKWLVCLMTFSVMQAAFQTFVI